jgi:hypothetical protein
MICDDLADGISRMTKAHPDLMRVVEDVADVQPELAARLVEALRHILDEREEDRPAPPVLPSPAAEVPHAIPAIVLTQSDEELAAHEEWRREREAHYRGRPALEGSTSWPA